MEKYQVKSIGRAPFKLVRKDEVLGILNYPNLYDTTNAEIKTADHNNVWVLKSSGIWKNNLELWMNETCTLSSKLTLNICVTIKIQKTEYKLKVKNLLKGHFTLQDRHENILVLINTNIDWSHAKADFEIDILAQEEVFTPEILLFLIHNCNYFLALSGNGSNAPLAAEAI